MATRPEEKRWTYSEFARLPDDGKRYEVIAGELYVSPSPLTRHQLVSQRLNRQLDEFVEQHDLGWVLGAPVDVLFAEGNYMVPDLIFVRRERVGIISDRGIEAAPDLIIEIASPSSARIDRGPKLQQYMRFGVPLYWVVDPDAGHVEVHELLGSQAEPLIEAETLTWTPVPSGPTLTIEVPPLFRGFE
ncbi:MAG: Uma2 family endonuclease [Gemmatimonas sp.]|nr:Uma2 family endonuclease [Gemmatimonas sp.]